MCWTSLNDADTIRDAFDRLLPRVPILASETDPDKLHDLQADLDAAQVYSAASRSTTSSSATCDGASVVATNWIQHPRRLRGGLSERPGLEDGQVDFKGKAKAFARTYGFLSCVLPYTNAAWEKRSIFLNFLISKLPAPEEEDLSIGHPRRHRHWTAIGSRSARCSRSCCPDENAEIAPVPPSGGGTSCRSWSMLSSILS